MTYISSAECFGMERGIAKGIEKVAINMLGEGIKITLIKKTTGLSTAKTKKLKRELSKKKH